MGDVVGSDGGVVPGGELERSRGMSRRSEDVPDLGGFCQGVEECRTGRGEGRLPYFEVLPRVTTGEHRERTRHES